MVSSMEYIKICSFCGNVNKAVRRSDLKKCMNENCGRSLENVSSMTKEEYDAQQKSVEDSVFESTTDKISGTDEQAFFFVNGEYDIRIRIPEGDSIIGRDGVGKSELKQFLSISRSHLKVRNNIHYLTVTDVSTYGTSINNDRIIKNEEYTVAAGDVISLHIYDFNVVKE